MEKESPLPITAQKKAEERTEEPNLFYIEGNEHPSTEKSQKLGNIDEKNKIKTSVIHLKIFSRMG